ncbi:MULTISPECIES: iron hydrogenase small subunit [Campylobacter]|uniref:iron hydrogenase small subunit n=1 Tax=Campylobacter TaxID=194 RepID=UPI0004D9CCC7|nr:MULTISPECIES: iron hydrogenase small subunit [Campylobacter]ANE31798.1 [FeFe] hydrogenase, small subunit [Campylobacter hyointestinalis subsp. hyointestinalis LMG 9260]KEA44101.1 iron hydrogenase [Campylobacter hyointestinalis subsp. hyointestinalis]OCR92071.1 iron hydrogenase [Campylobacter fetus subsp. testudinum]QKF54963.1 [Fe-Fe] hydrogenase, small subunit [Campylobacter hyointestinalis subsp. hyointestinalis]TXK47803.1 twin-arginine translocation signal domain-containing protein [Campy
MAKYIEKNVGKLLSRRDFLKVLGVSVSVVAISGYAITDLVKKRKSYISLRQQGLYRDDARLQKVNLTGSHQNSSCMQVYKDLKTGPMGETAEQLLHTNVYVDRTNLGLRSHHA